MVRPQREQGGDPRGGSREAAPSFFSNALFYVPIVLIVLNLLFSNPSAPRLANGTVTQRVASTEPSATSSLRPLARRGERFTVSIETQPLLFEPLRWGQLYFDHDALTKANISVTIPVDLGPCIASNCSITLKVGWSLRNYAFTASLPLIHFFEDVSVPKKYLFGGEGGGGDAVAAAAAAHSEGRKTVKQCFQPEVTLSPVVFFDHPLPDPYFDFTPVVESLPGFYGPALYINNFWVLREHYVELNASRAASPLNLTIHLTPAPSWKVLLYTQFEKTMSTQASLGMSRASDKDETKRMLLEISTKNPLLLLVTAVVTLLHSVFEFLAFSNDVKFWKGRKDFRGMSVRSIVINSYFQSIIFLYLLESSETSWVVLVPAGMGALMEYWKLVKTLKITKAVEHTCHDAQRPSEDRHRTPGRNGWNVAGYIIGFNDSYDARTQKHDDVAVRYLIYAMIPLLAANAVYSALYRSHRSWYSFIISTQVQFIYSFGFAQMTPQIFINYKMKSVGQLPWRSFIYKALNTVIDDLFAFVIKMPWLHRLACFQDDVVFAILLYQRWIYPVDMSRFDGEDGEENAAKSIASSEQEEAQKKNQ